MLVITEILLAKALQEDSAWSLSESRCGDVRIDGVAINIFGIGGFLEFSHKGGGRIKVTSLENATHLQAENLGGGWFWQDVPVNPDRFTMELSEGPGIRLRRDKIVDTICISRKQSGPEV